MARPGEESVIGKQLPFVSFYFDVADPASYLCWGRIVPLWSELNVCMSLEPVQLDGPDVHDLHVDDALWIEWERRAHELHRPLARPTRVIGSGRRATQICLAVRDRSGQEAMRGFVEALLWSVWVDGEDLDSVDHLAAICRSVSLPEELATEHDQPISAYTESIAHRARNQGIELTPSVVCEGELFAGMERTLDAERALRDRHMRSRAWTTSSRL